MCRSYWEEVETIEHMLFFCQNAETTWKLSPVQWDGLKDMRSNFVRWWEGILGAKQRDHGQEHIALTVNILWQIWKARNRKAFEAKETDPRKSVQQAIVEWEEHIEAQKDTDGECIQQTTNSSSRGKWIPAPGGLIQINTDAAFSQNIGRTGIGVVARNAEGKLVKAWARAAHKTSEPQMEEASLIRMGMQMAQEANWRAVEFQSDCKEVVDMINKETGQQSRVDIILEDIANMRYLFAKCTFSFVHRTGNCCACSLAKFVVKLTKNVEWKEYFLMWLHESAQNDYKGSNSDVSNLVLSS
ncbi:uncharacterized protein LOC113759629 [Coffea eugenioides]|uniref:uncharacterized protein LOC113759629 n=1 Tax=Coffea eugenioides TaxID=49369 RepID=UPI000F6149FE|nr:uncharacterized protein LOC113759629 [Coffea eugenioides]